MKLQKYEKREEPKGKLIEKEASAEGSVNYYFYDNLITHINTTKISGKSFCFLKIL